MRTRPVEAMQHSINMNSMGTHGGQVLRGLPSEKPPHSDNTGDEQAQSRRRKSVLVHRETRTVAEHKYEEAKASKVDEKQGVRGPGHTSFVTPDVFTYPWRMHRRYSMWHISFVMGASNHSGKSKDNEQPGNRSPSSGANVII